jgi:23S rRNA (adenine2503-C2)-methyltransferase
MIEVIFCIVPIAGQGEPFYNYRNVQKAVEILMEGGGGCADKCAIGPSFSTRKITLSTSGVAPIISRLGKDMGNKVRLAISLHSAISNDARTAIMPVNKLWPLEDIARACMEYNSQLRKLSSHEASRRVTYEYVMLKGVNDSLQHAQALCDFVSQRGMPPAHINLIQFNLWHGSSYLPSDSETLKRFEGFLQRRSIEASIRFSKGEDINAACGQLQNLYSSESASFGSQLDDAPVNARPEHTCEILNSILHS